jgi:hypothetical protein
MKTATENTKKVQKALEAGICSAIEFHKDLSGVSFCIDIIEDGVLVDSERIELDMKEAMKCIGGKRFVQHRLINCP